MPYIPNATEPPRRATDRVLLLTAATEKRKIDDLLTRQRRLAARGEMATALAQQIRTPLAAGLLYTTSARRAGLADEQRDALLDKAVACLHELERLIGDMQTAGNSVTVPATPTRLQENLQSVEGRLILDALERGGGRRKRAAEILGISPRTLRYKLARLRTRQIIGA